MPIPPSKEERDAEYKRKVTDVIAAMTPEERKAHAARGVQVVRELVADWSATREAVKQIDRDMHPDVTDALGRVWVWRWDDSYGSQYAHCGRLVEIERIDSVGVATQAMLDNQNYDLCPACIDGRKRNITACDPLWKCSHAVCATLNADG